MAYIQYSTTGVRKGQATIGHPFPKQLGIKITRAPTSDYHMSITVTNILVREFQNLKHPRLTAVLANHIKCGSTIVMRETCQPQVVLHRKSQASQQLTHIVYGDSGQMTVCTSGPILHPSLWLNAYLHFRISRQVYRGKHGPCTN